MTLIQAPMQLTPNYHAQVSANPRFLPWYLGLFTCTTRGYGHWSVSGYCSPDKAYHREILLIDGKVQVANPSGVDLTTDLHGHTDGRNDPDQCGTHAVALCVGSLTGADSTTDISVDPPTPEEITAFIEETAQVCLNLHMPVANLMTHAEAANNLDFPRTDSAGIPAAPSYGPGSPDFERWDWHVRIHTALKKCVPMFDGSTALYPIDRVPKGPINAREMAMPVGWAYFPDWWRGETLLRIMELTQAKWDV